MTSTTQREADGTWWAHPRGEGRASVRHFVHARVQRTGPCFAAVSGAHCAADSDGRLLPDALVPLCTTFEQAPGATSTRFAAVES